jgi:hypothetical protein
MKEGIVFSKEHAEFLTVTCLEWKHVLKDDRLKDINQGEQLNLR